MPAQGVRPQGLTRLLPIALLCVLPSLSAHAADTLLERADAAVARASEPSAPWTGPRSGPKAQADKRILYIAEDLRNGGVLGVGRGIQEAAGVIGWSVRVIDLQGSAEGRAEGFAKALAQAPDGVILGGMDALANAHHLNPFQQRGIPVVGWHVAPTPGPVSGTPVAFNVTSDNLEVARIAAYYALSRSRGRAKVVIFTDSNFEIAMFKANAMADVIRECDGCRLLSIEDLAISRAETLMPTRSRELRHRHGRDWQYSLAINDIYFDFADTWGSLDADTPETVNISAGDGSASAFQRIRSGGLQGGTVPEPLNLQGWQLVDELNRLLAGQPISDYVAPVHLVTEENVRYDGGERGGYDPDNGYREIYRTIWGREQ